MVTSRQCECAGLAQPILELYDTVVHPTSSNTQARPGVYHLPQEDRGNLNFQLESLDSTPKTLTNVGDGIDKANLSF